MSYSLVDTSVWVEFFRSGNLKLDQLLDEGRVILHPFIYGELVCCNFKNRGTTFSLLDNLPYCKPAMHNEVLQFIEHNRFYGHGVGWVDFHLLVAAKINNLRLFTLDKKLSVLSHKVGAS